MKLLNGTRATYMLIYKSVCECHKGLDDCSPSVPDVNGGRDDIHTPQRARKPPQDSDSKRMIKDRDRGRDQSTNVEDSGHGVEHTPCQVIE